MLVEELFIILLDISDLYGVRYLNYDLYVFQFEQTFRHFRAPARAPLTKPGPGVAYPPKDCNYYAEEGVSEEENEEENKERDGEES